MADQLRPKRRPGQNVDPRIRPSLKPSLGAPVQRSYRRNRGSKRVRIPPATNQTRRCSPSARYPMTATASRVNVSIICHSLSFHPGGAISREQSGLPRIVVAARLLHVVPSLSSAAVLYSSPGLDPVLWLSPFL